MKEEEEDYHETSFGSSAFSKRPPSLVSLSPFTPAPSPAPRRLSSSFSQPSEPVRVKRQLAWVSLQGRLVGAEEASSARAIGGGLSPEEALAWDLFTPIQRVLVVAVIAVATANSKKNKRISLLEKSVQLRDEVLSRMQEKLDNLCEQVNYFKDQPEPAANICWLCEQRKHLPKHLSMNGSARKLSMGEEEEFLSNEAEPEERRMSDLSDLAPSVASSADIQVNTATAHHAIFNLRRNCEEKDATINRLSACLQSSETLGSKRIAELEEIICKKNMVISKLKKEISILHQKVSNLTRLQPEGSFSTVHSPNNMHHPVLTDNIIYDMDSTTSPSSSDSDNPPRIRPQSAATCVEATPVNNIEKARRKQEQKLVLEKKPAIVNVTERHLCSRPVSPLSEISLNNSGSSVTSSKSKQASSRIEPTSRRKPPVRSKLTSHQKRWV
ncbi:unnamed protein product [Cuscuta epithymum]|uniref:Uncharacterized protein n=1 Tax=Cuscuta epithymum TaxID=186058 RepID=A0AAV0FGX7_9ASTE|nr:unnamed protein product [Cuscuta epithymum]